VYILNRLFSVFLIIAGGSIRVCIAQQPLFGTSLLFFYSLCEYSKQILHLYAKTSLIDLDFNTQTLKEAAMNVTFDGGKTKRLTVVTIVTVH